MLEFTLAVLFLVITPGPGVLSVAGIGSAYGWRTGLGYGAGLFVGNFTVALMVITGVAAAVLAVPGLRTVLLGLSVAYLLYLAARIAFAEARIGFITPDKAPGFWNGLALQPINPKAYVVNTTLFSGFGFMSDALWAETLIKLLIFNAMWIPIHLGWLWAGVTLRRLDLPQHVQKAINMGMALAMVLVVALALFAG